MNNRYTTFLIFIIAFAAGIFLCRWWYQQSSTHVSEQSKVLLERVKTVTKLITVEGYFSEVYDYKDYWGYDVFLFQKKALVLVKAKVSVGYDLEAMNIKADDKTKTMIISQLPQAQILSIDHSLSYYDISEGTFNSFSAEDYTKIQDKAKDFIRQKAEESDLKQRAQTQATQMLEVIRLMVENAGWTLKVNSEITPPRPLLQ
jgi:predicted SPOUT superfamily RNA methylase MTH1